uniref:Uncharacterized protein n=1 Tax=Globodera rostochiensis TaxID=31243 RepID=A0A914H3H1_GLORO
MFYICGTWGGCKPFKLVKSYSSDDSVLSSHLRGMTLQEVIEMSGNNTPEQTNATETKPTKNSAKQQKRGGGKRRKSAEIKPLKDHLKEGN